jgi:hypothetical protein
MREVTVSVQNAAEVICQDNVLVKRPELQAIVREAKTLEATHSPPFLWRNLNRKAYDLLTRELIKDLEKNDLRIIKKKHGQALRVEHCRAYLNDPGSVDKCIASGANRYPYLAIFRKGDQVHFTWYQ